jgi:RNA polymerase sigma-70 factor (ECF subfamily)
MPDFGAVLAAAERGEHWALTGLFRAYQPSLLRYLRGQEPGVADDLAGDVWVAVARRLGGFTGDELSFRSWLFTIARCRLVDHRRKMARRRTDLVGDDRIDLSAGAARYGRDPALQVLEHFGAQEAVDRLVSDLTPEQAEVVLLRVVAGFDVAEVARIMGRTAGSVRVMCHRALRRLAESMSEGVLTE